MTEKQRKNSDGKAKRLANLKPPFRKGQSGNPKGRPEGARNRSTVLKELLETVCDFQNPLTLTRQTADLETQVMVALVAKARRGDIAAIKEIQDTLYGKLTEKKELSGRLEIDVSQLSDDELRAIARGESAGRT